MLSNQIPEDVREKVARLLYDQTQLVAADVEDLIDDIAPLIIEWARVDQAEVDAQIVETHDFPGAAFLPKKIATALRAQFAGETTGGKTK